MSVKSQISKRQQVRCRRVSHVYKSLCARSPITIDVSVEVNCHKWPIIGYTRSWYIGMRYWNQCLQAPLLFRLSPAPTLFCRNFPRSAFATILERGTGLYFQLLKTVNGRSDIYCFSNALLLQNHIYTKLENCKRDETCVILLRVWEVNIFFIVSTQVHCQDISLSYVPWKITEKRLIYTEAMSPNVRAISVLSLWSWNLSNKRTAKPK